MGQNGAKSGFSKVNVGREFRDKYGMGMPTLKLARIMYKEAHPVFSSIEDARHILRSIEGKIGRSRVEPTHKIENRPYNPYNLPPSDASPFPPKKFTGYKRALIISDIHIPYHDIDAVTLCFDYAKKEKPDIIVIDGDLIDCHKLSKFVKDPTKRDFKYELDQMKLFFDILKKTFKGAKIVYKLGNHEIRYEHFLWQKAGELSGVEEFELSNIVKARAEGIEIVGDKTIVMLNELPIIHGHEFGRGQFNPVNTARGLFLKGVHTCLQADSHKPSKHSEPNMFKKKIVTWSIGCLCGLWPEYAVYNKWSHGFAMIDLDPNKINFEVRLKDIDTETGRVF